MFQRVDDAEFLRGEHACLSFWNEHRIFDRLREKNAGKPRWSFLDGPITANNPMGVHHAWGRTYKDCFQRFFAMKGRDQRYQNGFDCQGLWVEVEVEKELGLGTKNAVLDYGIDRFVNACKRRVLRFAARQTEQSIRLGYWMDWDDPDTLRQLAEAVGTDETVTITTPSGETVTDVAHRLVERLGNPEWGGSYFTFTTENNETIWTFLKKCFERGKVYRGHDVMPWSGRGGSAYSQMEVADGRRLTVHRSVFVRFPIVSKASGGRQPPVHSAEGKRIPTGSPETEADASGSPAEYLLVWTTTPWTLTSNVAAAVNPDLDYVRLQAKRDGAVYYFAAENLEFKRAEREFKEGFGRPEWQWPKGVGKLKTIAQIFKEQGGYEVLGTVKGADMVGWRYRGPFDELAAQNQRVEFSKHDGTAQSRITQRRFAIDLFGSTIGDVVAAADAALGDCAIDIHDSLDAYRPALKNRAERELVIRDLGPPGAAAQLRKFMDTLKALDAVDPTLVEMGKALVDDAATPLLSQAIAGNQKVSAHYLAKAMERVLGKLYLEVADWLGNDKTGASCHRVIDGGRDSKGNPHVVAGEGTGIVHIAPGCGDVDHRIGHEHHFVSIAPLGEDGRFGDGFGPFTGREAIDPETATLVFDQLKEKGLLVAVEEYPHIYPHCWRTGDELVFRLVDEWFIDMDWRDEIMDVTRQIQWLPDSIDGQNREVEWLTNMRDWMVSKKRFWGLALPIWFDPENPSDFEVIGSLEELRERAVEGWDDFDGNTPHRPWIDGVKIASKNTGAVLSRVPDVGNPWLDAGIVPFSTMHYNTNRDEWAKWFPADFVTECFPGQFRNWFYSLLSLATMMRHDETNDPTEKRPFKTLLGHRLVKNESDKPMHKSDGTAIWFEEAAEQLGVDTIRWMYLSQNPASDLRFGLRHSHKPVTLQTPEGPITETKEGMVTCLVTSGPADEIRRQVLIPLWNSYKFFVNYAALDEFDPTAEPVPVSERADGDRWVLSNLQQFLQTANERFEAYDTPAVCNAAAEFLDDLSNWYIRRNRARFWRKRVESGELSVESQDRDKLAAYQTLYEVLLTLSKALAPAIPFLAERMYQNLALGNDLVASGGREPTVHSRERGSATSPEQGADAPRSPGSQPSSVHLCDYPEPDTSLLDPDLNRAARHAQRVARMAHKLRDEANQRVRQPLAELRFSTADDTLAADVEGLADVLRDELNVKQLVRAASLDDLASYSAKPNLKTLGPKYGKQLGAIRGELPNVDPAVLAPLRTGENVELELGGHALVLEPGDVLFETETADGWHVADDRDVRLALDANLTSELVREGMSRDFIRHVQQQRKNANLDENAPIRITYATNSNDVRAAIDEWAEQIKTETRASVIDGAETVDTESVSVGSESMSLTIAAV